MRFEGSCRGAAGVGYQHGRLHLHKALACQELTDGGNDLGTLYKYFLCFRIHDQVDIPLTITQVRIGQTVILLRKNLQALGKQRNDRCMNADLTGLCTENRTLNADNIAHVQLFERLIGLLANCVLCHVRLDRSLQILHMAERSLTHDAFGHHAARHPYSRSVERLKAVPDLLAVMSNVVFYDLERIVSGCLQLCKLFAAYLQDLIQILLLRLLLFLLVPLVFLHLYF